MKYRSRLMQYISIAGLCITGAAASAAMNVTRSVQPPGQKTAIQADLNERMVRFCRVRLGKKVGSGQCADLTAQALLALGAETRFKDFPKSGDYVWGALISKLEAKNEKKSVKMSGAKSSDRRRRIAMKAGDIIQFRDAVFQGRIGRSTYRKMCPHHTAVIEKVSEDGSYCTVLEQNTSGKFYVVENMLRLPDLSAGWVRVYRPIQKRSASTAIR